MMGVTSVAAALCWALLVTLAHGLPTSIGPEENPIIGFTSGLPLAEMRGEINDGDDMVGFTPTPPASKKFEDTDAKREYQVELSDNDELLVNGLFQGDIMLSPQQWAELKERRAIQREQYYWKDKTVPYRFGDNVIDQAKVNEAVNHWTEHTCLKFPKVDSNYKGYHLIFINSGYCASWVGRQLDSPNGQRVWVAPSCVRQVGPTVHEIFHAVGSFHEQSRSDRDGYVKILLQNIQSGKEHNFNKHDTNNHDIKYDYNSVMHYGLSYFSSNGLPTLEPLNPLYTPLIGNRRGFTFRDMKMANSMYNCTDMWLSQCGISTNPCKNEGYIGKSCTCVCHPGTVGTNCDKLKQEYNDAMLSIISPGSLIIRDERTITSERYPQSDQDGSNFLKYIIAPECHKVKLVVTDFGLYGRQNGQCRIDYMRIKMDLNYGGNKCPNKDGSATQNGANACLYCGNEMPLPATFMSDNDRILLTYKSYDYASVGITSKYKGFKAIITHERISGCTPGESTTRPPTTSTTTKRPRPPAIIYTNSGDIPLLMKPAKSCQADQMRNPKPQFGKYETNYTYTYTSPGYPGYHDKNSTCNDIFYTNEPRTLNVTMESNHLHMDDKLGLIHHHIKKMFTRSNSMTNFILPSSAGRMSFASDTERKGYGFKFSVEIMNDRCNQIMNITDGIFGTNQGIDDIHVRELRKSGSYPPNRFCQTWFIAPKGWRMKVYVKELALGSPNGDGDYLLFDKDGDISYMTSPVKLYGNLTSTQIVVGRGRNLNMLFYGKHGGETSYRLSLAIIKANTKTSNPEATKLVEIELNKQKE